MARKSRNSKNRKARNNKANGGVTPPDAKPTVAATDSSELDVADQVDTPHPTQSRWRLGVVSLLAFSALAVAYIMAQAPHDRSIARFQLDSVVGEDGITGRYVLMLPATECVVLNFSPEPSQSFAELEQLVVEGRAEIVQESPDSYWGKRILEAGLGTFANSTFNCATYAVGDVIGLTERDWLQTSGTGDTFFQSPLHAVLDTYFELAETARIPSDRGALPRWSAQLRFEDSDVICFTACHEGACEVVHVGKVTREQGRTWVVSKFGKGPIVRTTLDATLEVYQESGVINQLQVYRERKGSRG